MKRLLVLGAESACRAYMKAARREQYEVITCDRDLGRWQQGGRDPLSIRAADKEAVLQAAMRYGASGILGIGASEAVAAAYATRRLELPGVSYAAMQTFQNLLFLRQFEEQHQFRVPMYREITNSLHTEGMTFPLYVSTAELTPGLRTELVYNLRQLRAARDKAMRYSLDSRIIAQERLHERRTGGEMDDIYLMTELVVRDGMLQPILFNECMLRLDCADPMLIGWRYPARLSARSRTLLVSECARLVQLLQLQNAQVGIVAYAPAEGMPYILAAGPVLTTLGMPGFLSRLYGRDLIQEMVRMAVGDSTGTGVYAPAAGESCMAYYAVRTRRSGILRRIRLDAALTPYMVDWDCQVRLSQQLYEELPRGMDLGRITLRFEDMETMDRVLDRMETWVDIEMDEV